MRKLLISTALIAVFSLPALAQPDHDHDHGPGGAPQGQQGGPPGGGGHDHGGGAPPAGANPSFGHGPNGAGRPTMTTNAPANNSTPAFSRGPGGGGFGHQAPSNPTYSRGPNGGGFDHQAPPNAAYGRGPNGGGNFNPGDRNMAGHFGPGGNQRGDQGGNRGGAGRHDFHGFVDFHQSFNAPRHFHAGGYRRPPGWYPHRWTFGEFLPAPFWAQDYWLSDYMDYALPPPPPYAVWVRYGDDALLIDQDSGEIITVEYGVFY